MRQGFAVTVLLMLVGLPTVFIAEGGWRGVQSHWIEPAAGFVSDRLVSMRFGGTGSPDAADPTGIADIGNEVTGAVLIAAQALVNGRDSDSLASRPSIDPFLVHPKTPSDDDRGDAEITLAADIQSAAHSAVRAGARIVAAVAPRDYGSAYRWYTLAADPDDAEVRYAIARDYLDRPVEPDYAAAAHWLISAAELGHARAQLDLGEMYIEGNGVTRNYPVAFKWLALAKDRLTNGDQLVLAIDKLQRLNRAMTPDERADAAIMIDEWQPKTFAQNANGMATPTVVAGDA